MLEDYFINDENSELKRQTENLVLYPYNTKSGKDCSDLIRGQILGVKAVFSILAMIEQFEINRVEIKKIQDKMKGATGN